MDEPSSFVRVQGQTLSLDSKTYSFSGANCYLLLTRSAGAGTRPEVLEVLDAARRLRCTVLRTWAFNDGDGWRPLQTAPGVYDRSVFDGLDWLLVECRRRGLRLILCLTNYWPDFGGMQQYVTWSRQPGAPQRCPACRAAHCLQAICDLCRGFGSAGGSGRGDGGGSDVLATTGSAAAVGAAAVNSLPAATSAMPLSSDEFYSDSATRRMFVANMEALVCRVNSLTGVMYRDDPMILAWELANEPRCPSDPSGDTLQAWISIMAAALRAMDPHHLIGLGAEGFFGPSTPDLQHHNPYSGSHLHGEDWLRNAMDPNIDFASIHLYPDQWLPAQQGGSSSSNSKQTQMPQPAVARSSQIMSGSIQIPAPPLMLLSEQQQQRPGLPCSQGVSDVRLGQGIRTDTRAGDTGGDAGGADDDRRTLFALRWIRVHEEVARTVLRKPLVIGEFGAPAAAGDVRRHAYFQQVYRECFRHAPYGASRSGARGGSSGALAGVAFWMLAHRSYPDYDGYTLHQRDIERDMMERDVGRDPSRGNNSRCLAAAAEYGRQIQARYSAGT